MTKRVTPSRPPKPSSVANGLGSRKRLLEVAGQIFAEKGFDRATSKEITEKAGTNVAAVNYHFGGVEGLYAAVVEEASTLQFSSVDVLAAMGSQPDAKAKLEAFLGAFVRVLTSPAAASWRPRILMREFSAPALPHRRRSQEPFRKATILKGIVAELLGLPDDHGLVARGCLSVIAPCFMLATSDRAALKRAFPHLGLKPADEVALTDYMVRYALAGLSSVAADLRSGGKNG